MDPRCFTLTFIIQKKYKSAKPQVVFFAVTIFMAVRVDETPGNSVFLALVSGPIKMKEEMQFSCSGFSVLCLSLELFAYSLLLIFHIYKKIVFSSCLRMGVCNYTYCFNIRSDFWNVGYLLLYIAWKLILTKLLYLLSKLLCQRSPRHYNREKWIFIIL